MTHKEEPPLGLVPFIGRLLIGMQFIIWGIWKLVAPLPPILGPFQQNISLQTKVYLMIFIILELIGGLFIILGWQTRLGCAILMVIMLPPTFGLHAFWNYQGQELNIQLLAFLDNICIYGGLILLMCYGPGTWALDKFRKQM